MKAFLLYFLLFAFLSIFQASFLAFLFPTAVPSPFIPFLISLILYTENLPLAFSLATLAGLFLDLFSSSLFGLYMVVYLVCVLLVSTWRRTFFQKGFLTWFLLIAIFDLFSQLLYTLFLVIGGYPLTWEVFSSHLSWHLLYTVLLAFIFYSPSIWMLKLVSQRRLAI